jgi:hypothetical protein
MQRKYDRHIPAKLPAKRMLLRSMAGLPVTVDTRTSCGPVKDQGSEGACTAHAGTSAREWIGRRYLKQPTKVFSPQYVYAKELIAQGDFPQDDGSDGTTLCGVLTSSGCCELDLYPYVPGQINMPTVAQDQNAVAFRLGAYHGLQGSQTALSVLGDPTPWPVEIGFTVYESFESDELAETGIMPIPAPSEEQIGGHEVLMVGYDVGSVPTLRPANCPAAALIQNSWGTSWGIGGFFWMPLQILDAQDSDLKIAHSGAPWK